MTTAPVPLPTRRSEEAPRFDPKIPLSLWDYFVDYEVLANAAQLDEATKIQRSVIYLTRDEAGFWESLDEYEGSDWQAFKNAVLSAYPGSIPNERFALNDLYEFLEAQKTKTIQTRGDFAEFHRQFSTISKFLIRNELLSDLEERKLYWSAFDQNFKAQLIRKVELTKPAYTSRIILTIAEIRSAADLVLDGTLAETSSAVVPDTTSSIRAPPLEPVKAEPFSMERFTQQMSAMMAQTVQTAITTALDRVTSTRVPSSQMNPSRRTFRSAHINEAVPAYSRNVPLMQKADNAHSRFSNLATVASSNASTVGTSTNLVKVKNVSPVETRVESKADLDAHIAALRWRISRQEDDDDEGLEDVIRVLKARISKKRTEGISHQGPQEKRTILTRAVPSIPAKVVIPSQLAPESSPVLVLPVRKVLEQRRAPEEVVVEPVNVPEEVLGPTVTLSVQELLTSCPEVRDCLQEAVASRLVVKMDSQEKDLEKEEMTPHGKAFLLEEKSRSEVVCQNRREEAHTTPSEPREASVGSREEVIVEKISLEDCKELSNEVSHDCFIFDSSKERYCSPLFLMFSDVIESHRIKESPMYSQPPPVELSTVSSMCLIAPPVSACHSIIANLPTVAVAKSFVVETNRRRSEVKEYRREMKKLVQLFRYPRNGGLVYLGTFRIVLPARPHPSKLPNGEEFIARTPSPRLMPSPKSQSQPACLVEISTDLAVPQSVKEAPTGHAAVIDQGENIAYRGKLALISQRAQFNLPTSVFVPCVVFPLLFESSVSSVISVDQKSSETNQSPRVVKEMAPLKCDLINGVSVQLDASWKPVLVCTHPETSTNAEALVSVPRRNSLSSKSEKPHASFVEVSTVVAATSRINKPLTCKAAVPVDWEKTVILESVASGAIPNQSSVVQHTFIHPAYFPSFVHPQNPDYMSSPSFTSESIFISASQWNAEAKTSRQWILKTVQLLGNARSKMLVQLGTSGTVIPVRQYPERLPYDERLIYARSPRWRLHSKSMNQSVLLVELLVVFAAPPIVYEAPTRSTVVFPQDEEVAHLENPGSFPLFFLFIPQSSVSLPYPPCQCIGKLDDVGNSLKGLETRCERPLFVAIGNSDARRPKTNQSCQRILMNVAPSPHDLKREGLAQLRMFRVVIPTHLYPTKSLDEERLVFARSPCRTPLPNSKCPHIFLAEFPTTRSAAQPLNEAFMLISAAFVLKIAELVPLFPILLSMSIPHPLFFVSTPSQIRRFQTRLEEIQGDTRMRYDVEWNTPVEVEDRCLLIGWSIETKPRYRGLIVVIWKTMSGVWIRAETYGTVGNLLFAEFRCRHYRALSLDGKDIAKIVGAEEDIAGTEAEENNSLSCLILAC